MNTAWTKAYRINYYLVNFQELQKAKTTPERKSVKVYRLNLLPPEMAPPPYVQRRRLLFLISLILLGALLIFGAGLFFLKMLRMQNELEVTRAELAVLAPAVEKAKSFRAETKKLTSLAVAFENLTNQNRIRHFILEDFARYIPQDVWLTEVDLAYSKEAASTGEKPGGGASPASVVPPEPNIFTIKGVSRSVPSIGVYQKKLSERPYFLMVRLDEFSETGEGTLAFTFTATLAPGGGGLGDVPAKNE